MASDAATLKNAFKEVDKDSSGTVAREVLADTLSKFMPNVSQADVANMVQGFGPKVDYNHFVDFLFGQAPAPSAATSSATHVAIVGAGFVGTCTAYAILCKGTVAKVTVTDVNADKCEGEALDLEDGYGRVEVATPKEAGQADVIIITAGRGQKEGETRLDLIKANSGIMKSVINGMQPIKPTAKIIIVSNPCDALTYVAQESSGLPIAQVIGSGTVLDSTRLQVTLGEINNVNPRSIKLYVMGEHGDSQFPAVSLANCGGVPLMEMPKMQGVDVYEMCRQTARKAYDIISAKNYTAFGVAQAVESIVDCVVNDRRSTMSVSVRVPGRNCCMSLPCVLGINGVERILEHVTEHFSPKEKELYESSILRMQVACGTAPEGTVIPESNLPAPAPNTPIKHEKVGGKHVAVIGAGFVGCTTAFAMVTRKTASRITLTDVNEKKCAGEVMDLEDGGHNVEVATPAEAGQADVIVVTAGRPQRPGETRLDLVKANAAILRSIIKGMQPIKATAKMIIVANPCDALTYVAQECSGLPQNQVLGSGTLLDSRRLRIALARRIGVEPASITLHVLGEHGDSQFPIASLSTCGGVPLMECTSMQSVNLMEEASASAKKAYTIIGKKGYTAFGIARAVESITRSILSDRKLVLPVTVRVPGKACCLSLPAVVGSDGVTNILEHVCDHMNEEEAKRYAASVKAMEEAAAAAMA